MKQLIVFLMALIFIATITTIVRKDIINFQTNKDAPLLRITYADFQKIFLYIKIYSKNRPVVIGSSDLSVYYEHDGDRYHIRTFYEKFNAHPPPVLIGSGHAQNLFNYVVLASGAINQESPILIYLSPQHFTGSPNGTTREQFTMHLTDKFFYRAFLNSPSQLQSYLSKRFTELELSKSSDFFITQVISNNTLKSLFKPITTLLIKLDDVRESFLWKKNEYFGKNPRQVVQENRLQILSPNDLEQLKQDSILIAKDKSTSNPYGINDYYYYTYVKDSIKKMKVDKKNYLTLEGREWDDYRALCELIKLKKFKVYFFIPPVHEKFYSTLGYDFSNRRLFYKKIEEIAYQYNIPILSLGNHSNELYWLRDPMHQGWLSNIEILKVIYDHFKISQ